ncbi:MAG: type II toxin-antitoxin system VapC family toxin [Ignavibacteria bacterium]|nr:type II toxin-antitoxin system VapC family toxin [Ignavibacteria bacterium]
MNYLLDTQTFLWFIENNKNLPDSTRSLIQTTQDNVYVSIVTPWEIAIKTSIGKLALSKPIEALFPLEMTTNSFILLPISYSHSIELVNLPFHHNDPFDRMLIAQAMNESLSIISRDTSFDDYGIHRIW